MTVVSRYLVHAAVLVIALAISGYASVEKGAGQLTSLRLGAVSAEGLTNEQGGSVGQVALGRTGTIIKPLEIPVGPAVSHNPLDYTVADGEDVKTLADRFGVTADDLRWSNASLTSTDILKAGQTLTVPPVHGLVYTVKDGDTLDKVATAFHVEAGTVRDFNYLRTDQLDAGTQLVIPGGVGPELFPRRVSYDPPHMGNFPNNRFAYGYCTWYVASRRSVPWTGDAWAWFGGAKAMGFATGSTPEPGAIMVTWESYVGHVAYVESVNADGSFTVSEMNYKGWGIISTRTIRTNQVPLIGFIY